ncbi:MAG: hypothetical protein LUC92_07215 [Clostridiales bacterium]|nr:hypothetical protein [Clostridiales bacterium]
MVNKIRKIIGNIGKNFAVMYAAILGLSCIVALLGIRPLMLSKTISVTVAKKALPIYCVDRDDNRVAISFDAAWGAYRLRRNFTHCV